ncbi:MAG: hypothetical protein IIZ78_00865 [Clostridiales bacterium]|nr:hypothetical protein [Clostridiales bacterium]
MKKGRLKERDSYTYSMIKDVFYPYTGQARRFVVNDYILRLDVLSLLFSSGKLSINEYRYYVDHLHRADTAGDRRFLETV